MRKGQQKLINMLKKANVSEENIQEFARSTEPLPMLKICAYQLVSGTDITMEDAKRYIDDGITFNLNDNITISLTRNGCIHIPVVRKYRERLQYAESLPSGPEHFPREGLVELYSIGLSETDIDRLIGAYRGCESGSYIISQDIKAEKEYLRYARATYGRKDTLYIDHSMAWKESYLILNAVEYLYNAGYDIDRLTSIIPQLADYERELIPTHTIRNNGRRRLVQQYSLDKSHPGLISAINNDTEDEAPEFVTRNMPEVHPVIHRTLPELGNVLYSCSNRINELQNILIRMIAGTHKFPDLSDAFEDAYDDNGTDEITRCNLSDDELALLKESASMTEKNLMVNGVKTRTVRYGRYEGSSFLSFRCSDILYIEPSERITCLLNKSIETTVMFYEDGYGYKAGGAYIKTRYPYQKNSKARPLTLSDLVSIRARYGEICDDIISILMSKEAGTALFDIWNELNASNWNSVIPPLSYEKCLGLKTKNDIAALYKMTFSANFNKHPISAFYIVKASLSLFRKEDRDKICEYYRQGKFDGAYQDSSLKGRYKKYGAAASILMAANNIANDKDIHRDLTDYVEQQYRLGNKLKLKHSLKKMMDEHARHAQEEAERKADYTIVTMPKKSVFAPLRDMLPADFEWITDTKRLFREGSEMHHCVATYGNLISQDLCAIYSLLYRKEGSKYDGRRYTIEFVQDKRFDEPFIIRQVQAKYDRGCPEEVCKYIRSFLDAKTEAPSKIA